MGIVNHIPGHAIGHRAVAWAIHADGLRATASEWAFDPTSHTRDGEVVPDNWYASFAHVSNNRFYVLELKLLFGTVQKDVMPVRGIKILDGFEAQTFCLNRASKIDKLFERPELVRVAGQTPSGIVANRLIAGAVACRPEVIDQVNDQVGAAALACKTKMVAIQLMAIQTEAELHNGHSCVART